MDRPIHTDIREVVDEGLSRFPLEDGREVRRTDAEEITDALDAQVLIAVMLMHIGLCLRHEGSCAVAARYPEKRLHLVGTFLHPCTQGLQVKVLYLLKEVLILSENLFHRQMIRIHEAMALGHELHHEEAIRLQRRIDRCLRTQKLIDLTIDLFRRIQLDGLEHRVEAVIIVLCSTLRRRLLLGLRCHLHDVDRLSAPIDDTVGHRLPGTLVGLRQAEKMIDRTADTGGDGGVRHMLTETTQHLAVIRQLRQRPRLLKLHDHHRIAEIGEEARMPLRIEVLLPEPAHRHRDQQRIDALRREGNTVVQDHHTEVRTVEADLIVHHIATERIRRLASLDERRAEILLQDRQTLHVIVLQHVDVLLLVELLIQRCVDALEHGRELIRIDRLQDVLLGLQTDGFLCVLELVEAREDDDLDGRILLLQTPAELESIHERHLDVRHDDIRLLLLGHLQRFQSVVGIALHREAELLPVHLPDDHLDNILLVIHQHHSVFVQCKLPSAITSCSHPERPVPSRVRPKHTELSVALRLPPRGAMLSPPPSDDGRDFRTCLRFS